MLPPGGEEAGGEGGAALTKLTLGDSTGVHPVGELYAGQLVPTRQVSELQLTLLKEAAEGHTGDRPRHSALCYTHTCHTENLIGCFYGKLHTWSFSHQYSI